MRWGELDIVGYMDDVLVVVEVRSVTNIDDLHDYVSSAKMGHLHHSVNQWVYAHNWKWPIRIDVVYVKWNEVVEWFQNVTNS